MTTLRVAAPRARAVAAGFEAAARRLEDLTDVDSAAAALVAPAAAAAAPRRSGRLRGSIRAAGPRITSGLPYAVPVHARRPYVRIGVAAVRAEVTDLYAREITHALSQIG